MAQQALAAKEKGNRFFVEGNYPEAIKWYTEAIKYESKNHVFFSNRSAAHAGLRQWKEALDDAEQCIRLNPGWGKGYYRKSVALVELGKTSEAKQALQMGLSKEPSNNDLKMKLNEVEEELRKKNKFTGPDGKPLTGSALAKAQGNDLFKNGMYEDAMKYYSRALEQSSDPAEKATLYNNRAACWSQFQNWHAMLEDCNLCLQLEPKNAKALLRRGIAFEGLEKHKLALQDMKGVLELDPTSKFASSAIVRLSRLVQ